MARSTTEPAAPDDKQPFEHFRETVKALLSVPKEEVNEALHTRQKERKQSECRDGN